MKPMIGRQAVEAEHFDRLADSQGEIWWGSATAAGKVRLKRRAELVAGLLRELDDPLVVELGCGVGAFAQTVLAELPQLRLWGLDVSSKSIEIAKERLSGYPRVRFDVGDALALDSPGDSVDAVIGNSVLHHLPLEGAIAESYRVLKPHGLLWFSEPNMLNPEIAIEKNVKFIGRLLQNTQDETAFFRWPLAKLLKQSGFRYVRIVPYDFLHPIVMKPLIRIVDGVGRVMEQIPIVRELAGSLQVIAKK